MSYKNVGKTPAVGLQTGFAVFFDRRYSLATNIPAMDMGGLVAFPGQELVINSQEISSKDYMDAFKERRPGYVFGAIMYRDVFGKRHWTKFNLVMDIRTHHLYPDSTGNECDTNE